MHELQFYFPKCDVNNIEVIHNLLDSTPPVSIKWSRVSLKNKMFNIFRFVATNPCLNKLAKIKTLRKETPINTKIVDRMFITELLFIPSTRTNFKPSPKLINKKQSKVSQRISKSLDLKKRAKEQLKNKQSNSVQLPFLKQAKSNHKIIKNFSGDLSKEVSLGTLLARHRSERKAEKSIIQIARTENSPHTLKRLRNKKEKASIIMTQSRSFSPQKQKIKQNFEPPNGKKFQFVSKSNKTTFDATIQSANLQQVFQISNKQFNLNLRIDTNTHGHQNWFYFGFQVQGQSSQIRFNVCNLKRSFKMIEIGQKIYLKGNDGDVWEPAGQNIIIVENSPTQLDKGKLFKLSFSINIKANIKYQIAILPPYTYSQMLKTINSLFQNHQDTMSIDCLAKSLTGKQIPIVTITNKRVSSKLKKVILIQARIHPGQSISSYVVEGVMKKLVNKNDQQMSALLSKVIFKIIPMANPDGVIYGNFRTNYLGIDLNRGFDSNDDVLNPQICAIKNIGKALLSEFKDRFIYFIDLHGHSSKKNIFAYGPNYNENSKNFEKSKYLPKTLSLTSKYFSYQSCTFKLEDHKKNTARGYFLNELKIMSYTIESTYSMYDNLYGDPIVMGVQNWVDFGKDLALGFQTCLKLNDIQNSKSQGKMKKNDQQILSEKIMLEIKRQKSKKSQIETKQENPESQESDGESECEDLSFNQRKQTQKNVLSTNLDSFLFERSLKASILYPTQDPKLPQIKNEKVEGCLQIYPLRSKFHSQRIPCTNYFYTNYLKNLQELKRFKPSSKNIKLFNKFQS